MQGYNFTNTVRQALGNARQEAVRLGHEYVGPEHVLLGLLCQESSVALSVIESFGIAPNKLTTRVEGVIKRGTDTHEGRPDVPYTSRAKRVLELAMAEARTLNHAYVGTEHLLLGLIHEERGVAAVLLVESGITLDAARARTVEMLDSGKQDDEGFGRREPSITARARATKRASSRSPATSEFTSGSLAASVIEALATHSDVAAVFSARGIDIAKLTAALRAASRPTPLGDAPSSSAGDSPPETSPPAA